MSSQDKTQQKIAHLSTTNPFASLAGTPQPSKSTKRKSANAKITLEVSSTEATFNEEYGDGGWVHVRPKKKTHQKKDREAGEVKVDAKAKKSESAIEKSESAISKSESAMNKSESVITKSESAMNKSEFATKVKDAEIDSNLSPKIDQKAKEPAAKKKGKKKSVKPCPKTNGKDLASKNASEGNMTSTKSLQLTELQKMSVAVAGGFLACLVLWAFFNRLRG